MTGEKAALQMTELGGRPAGYHVGKSQTAKSLVVESVTARTRNLPKGGERQPVPGVEIGQSAFPFIVESIHVFRAIELTGVVDCLGVVINSIEGHAFAGVLQDTGEAGNCCFSFAWP